jgi:putative membrane protein
VFGSILISVVSWLLNSFINERGTVKYINLGKKRRNR